MNACHMAFRFYVLYSGYCEVVICLSWIYKHGETEARGLKLLNLCACVKSKMFRSVSTVFPSYK